MRPQSPFRTFSARRTQLFTFSPGLPVVVRFPSQVFPRLRKNPVAVFFPQVQPQKACPCLTNSDVPSPRRRALWMTRNIFIRWGHDIVFIATVKDASTRGTHATTCGTNASTCRANTDTCGSLSAGWWWVDRSGRWRAQRSAWRTGVISVKNYLCFIKLNLNAY